MTDSKIIAISMRGIPFDAIAALVENPKDTLSAADLKDRQQRALERPYKFKDGLNQTQAAIRRVLFEVAPFLKRYADFATVRRAVNKSIAIGGFREAVRVDLKEICESVARDVERTQLSIREIESVAELLERVLCMLIAAWKTGRRRLPPDSVFEAELPAELGTWLETLQSFIGLATMVHNVHGGYTYNLIKRNAARR